MIFKKKKPSKKEQVRFMAKPGLYSEFKKEVKKNGLYIQDVFETLIVDFVSRSKNGRIKVK